GRNAAFGRPAAGKSGTSQESRDAWFIGYTDKLVTGVWIGNDDGSPMGEVNRRAMTGGGVPAEIWRDFMRAAHESTARGCR
ncbi:MAG: penicillin-binding protein 1A, partial [Alphaproteobacteria bacterium]